MARTRRMRIRQTQQFEVWQTVDLDTYEIKEVEVVGIEPGTEIDATVKAVGAERVSQEKWEDAFVNQVKRIAPRRFMAARCHHRPPTFDDSLRRSNHRDEGS